jgi:hypothetical protein
VRFSRTGLADVGAVDQIPKRMGDHREHEFRSIPFGWNTSERNLERGGKRCSG